MEQNLTFFEKVDRYRETMVYECAEHLLEEGEKLGIDFYQLAIYYAFLEENMQKYYFKHGLVAEYEPSDPGFARDDVLFWSASLAYDYRATLHTIPYLCHHSPSDLYPGTRWSEDNRLMNILLSHISSANNIHRKVTGESRLDNALLDFEQFAQNHPRYNLRAVLEMRERCLELKRSKTRLFSSTELHTAQQRAAKTYVRSLSDFVRTDIEENTIANIIEWIASWWDNGTIQSLKSCQTFADAYNALTSNSGMGAYYGSIGAVELSYSHSTRFSSDEPAIIPGPSATRGVNAVFPNAKRKLPKHCTELIKWVWSNQWDLFEPLGYSSDFWKIDNLYFNNKPYFNVENGELDMRKLTFYGAELNFCQCNVWMRIHNDPKLMDVRARATRQPYLEDDLK